MPSLLSLREACVLRQLHERRMYGLELVAGSRGLLSRSALYNVLGRMEDRDLIRGSAVPAGGRRMYRITPAGVRALREMLAEPVEDLTETFLAELPG